MVVHPEAALLELARILDAAGIVYAVGGSVASGHHGEIRATNDIDLLVELGLREAQALREELGAEWHVDSEALRAAAVGDGSVSILHLEHMVKVDLFPATEARLDRLQLDRRVAVHLGEQSEQVVWFTSPEDTILRKLEWYRRSEGMLERQLRDVAGVLKTLRSELDLAYLRAAARELALDELLERALEGADLA